MLPETNAQPVVGDSRRYRLIDAIRRIFPDWAEGMEMEYYCFELRMVIQTTGNDETMNAMCRRICKENNVFLIEIPSHFSFLEMVERLKAFSDDV